MADPTNRLRDFGVDRNSIGTIGHGLRRPECVLATPAGTLFTSDARGGIMRIDANGSQTLLGAPGVSGKDVAVPVHEGEWVGPTLPNGLAFDGAGGILIADVGARALRRLTAIGAIETLHTHVDGVPLGIVNFVLTDRRGRIWFTVTTCCEDPLTAMNQRIADGYVGLIDERGIRIVADGFCGTNELRLDAGEQWLYVVESYAQRVSRLRIGEGGSLDSRETFGPSCLGPVPDGCAFDADGNLWVTCVFAEKIIALTPDGDMLTILDAGDAALVADLDSRLSGGTVSSVYLQSLPGNAFAPWLSSLTFGGPDLRTVYLGSGKGDRIAYFRSPVPGLPMSHWHR